MNTVKTLIIAGALLVGGTAQAQKKDASQPTRAKSHATSAGSLSAEPGTYTKADYPDWYVLRSLLLPQGMVQADSTLAISSIPSQTGASMNLGVDVGLHPTLQAGMLMSLPLTPDGGFGMLVGNLQYGVAPFMNLRFDLGAARLSQDMPAPGGGLRTETVTGFVWGLGLPMKWRVGERVALTTGRTTASAFGSASSWNGYLMTSDDIVTMTSGSFRTMNGGDFNSTIWTFGLPVGVLVQPHDLIGLGLRTGFRLLRGDVAADTAIPLAFDLMAHVARPVDLGFTFELPGWTSDYGAIKDVNVWAQARF
jgi:hypothetical protein